MKKYEFTLAQARAAYACYTGYNKVACALAGEQFDEDRFDDFYYNSGHTDPVPLEFVLDSNGVDDAFWVLLALFQDERNARVFLIHELSRIGYLFKKGHLNKAIAILKAYAQKKNKLTRAELHSLYYAIPYDGITGNILRWAASYNIPSTILMDIRILACGGSPEQEACPEALEAEHKRQVQLFRAMLHEEAPWQGKTEG